MKTEIPERSFLDKKKVMKGFVTGIDEGTDVGATNDENHDVTPVVELNQKKDTTKVDSKESGLILDAGLGEANDLHRNLSDDKTAVPVIALAPDERFKKPKPKKKEEEKKETPFKAMTSDFKKSIRKEERKKRYYVFRDRAKNFFRIENPLESVFRLADFVLNVFVLSAMVICIIKAIDFMNQGDWIMLLATGGFVLLLSWINKQIT